MLKKGEVKEMVDQRFWLSRFLQISQLVTILLFIIPVSGDAATINTWYGDEQNFGKIGLAQHWVNILGNVSDPDGIQSLTYSLDGGITEFNLSIGADGRRLNNTGDFNVEIDSMGLANGPNNVLIKATDLLNNVTFKTVTVNRYNNSWPIPYPINWNSVTNLQDVAQIVDGFWSVSSDGVRSIQPGYDRIVAIGDMSWTDYEVTVPITFNAIDPDSFNSDLYPYSAGPGIGVILRWRGHVDADGSQPTWGWWVTGCSSWYEFFENGQGALRSCGDVDPYGRTLNFKVSYIWKMRVQTIAGTGSLYSFKLWENGQSEPQEWQMTGLVDLESEDYLESGSFLLVAHHVDATFGNVTVTLIPDGQDLCPSDPNKIDPGICGCGISDIDSDEDGIPDCNDSCPNDPNKTDHGICGCGVSDVDSDSDEIPDCNDNCNDLIDTDNDGTSDCNDRCPNDPNKINPGICGCGVADIDTDSDGTLDCNDNCSNDPNKINPGICGCGAADTDSDGDGIPNCNDMNNDSDILPDEEEQGPNGDVPNYDGNHDGIADCLQGNVVSFHTYDNQNYLTMESPAGTSIINFNTADNPSPANAPPDLKFSYGFFVSKIDGIGIGKATIITLHLPDGVTVDTYYKYGPTPNNTTNHWYEFLYNGQTGAIINGNVIKLYFVDGARGDNDLTANGIIVDDSAPAEALAPATGTTVASDSDGGGGCFIATAAYGSLMEPHVKTLRDFRDRFLLGNRVGDSFIHLYYTYSPPIADFIKKHDSLKAMVRVSLLPVVGASLMALKIGLVPTVALMLFFISCFLGLFWFKRRYK